MNEPSNRPSGRNVVIQPITQTGFIEFLKIFYVRFSCFSGKLQRTPARVSFPGGGGFVALREVTEG